MAVGGARQVVAVTRASVLDIDPKTYQRHALHADDRVWVEKNCYVDIWIEMMHSLEVDPVAMLPFVVALDFEGDQWTFWKPPHRDLWDLYRIDVQELNVWRPLIEHAVEHLDAGKLISTEADAFWLPDTAGTDYRRQHTKTTIIINDLDVGGRRLGYFHNAAYYTLESEDFVQTFHLDGVPDPSPMPLFAEIVRIDRIRRREPGELRQIARDLLRSHLERRPAQNPVRAFASRFELDLEILQERGLEFYHQWAFATVRQLGGASEAAAMLVRWFGDAALQPAAEAFDAISNGMKTFILKAARAVNAKRALDARAQFEEIAAAWERGIGVLEAQV